VAGTFDTARLAAALARFGGATGERRVVARQAGDLAAAGRLDRDRGTPLTVERVLSELAAAPSGGPADRWNWWLGSMEAAHGGYRAFAVRRFPGDG
jgi:hypothetical protein